MFDITEYICPQAIIIVISIILLILALSEVLDIGPCARGETRCYYSYNPVGGPMTWKQRFPDAQGKLQSPINIGTSYAIVKCSQTLPPLEFSPEYHDDPCGMKIFNDGHSVTISACWASHICPKICGGPLKNPYTFFNIRIRWGPCDEEGSEHTINCRRFALEMQATYVNANKSFNNLSDALAQKGLLIVSYLYQAVQHDNPYLKPLINGLKKIRSPHTDVDINPVPISCLLPAFSSKYYMYEGSLTTPPCTEGITWIVQSEPISISHRQVNKFRKLCSLDGPIELNTRPVQDLNWRKVYFYD